MGPHEIGDMAQKMTLGVLRHRLANAQTHAPIGHCRPRRAEALDRKSTE